MAERKAQNKYYPPEWTPAHGSINSFVKNKGKIVIKKQRDESYCPSHKVKFEMPFNVYCLKCNKLINMGVRFNSQKKKIGSYISTDIFQFSLGCIFCGNKIIIVTEPATCTYQITLGARLKIETWDPETSGAIVLEDSIEKEKRESNSFAKLDHVINDINKLKNSGNHFNELFDVNERDWNDPYTNNQRLRKKFRIEQDKRNIEYNEMTSIRDKMNLSIDVLPLNEEDLKVSKELDFTRFLPKNTSGIFGGDVRNVLLKGQSLGINGDPFQIRKQDHEKQAADLNSKITDRKLVDYDSE